MGWKYLYDLYTSAGLFERKAKRWSNGQLLFSGYFYSVNQWWSWTHKLVKLSWREKRREEEV